MSNDNLKFIKKVLIEPKKFLENIDQYKNKACFSQGWKKYGCFDNWSVASEKLSDLPKNENIFNELILPFHKVKPYLDVEWTKELFNYDEYEVAQEIKKGICFIFQQKWNVNIDKNDICVLECHRKISHGEFKYSFHFIISTTNPVLVFKNTNEASVLAEYLKEYLLDKNIYDLSIVDKGVYKKTQNFRLLGHSKDGEFIPLQVSCIDNNRNRPIEDTIITNVGTNISELASAEQRSEFKYGFKLQNVEVDEDLLLEKIKIFHPTVFFEKKDNNGFFQFNYKDRSEPCFTGNIHDHIGFFTFIKETQIYAGCFSGNCTDNNGKKILKLIGKMEESDSEKIDSVSENENFDVDFSFVSTCVGNRCAGLSELFKKMYKDRINYDNNEKKFYYWKDNLWILDDNMYIEKIMVYCISRVLQKFIKFIKDSDNSFDLKMDSSKNNDIVVKETQKFINDLKDGLKKKQIIEFLYSDLTNKNFINNKDIHPYFIAAKNGMVNLRTGETRNFKPSDYVSKCLDIEYDPSSDSSLFDNFVREITNYDEDLYNFIRWMIGYSIQGDPNRKIYFILWGRKGYNGKSALLNTLRDILKTYCGTMDSSVVLKAPKRTAGSHSSELVHMQYSRLGILNDIEENETINVGQIKQITGVSDNISARQIYGKQIEFRPVFVPFICANVKPNVDLTDEALYKRTMVIPFEISFVENPVFKDEKKVDLDLENKFRKNKKGTLKWIIDCGLYYHNKYDIDIPPKVQEAREEYRKRSDIVGQFIDERIIKTNDENEFETFNNLYLDFKAFCTKNEMNIMERQQCLDTFMKKLEFKKTDVYTYKFINIKLKKDVAF